MRVLVLGAGGQLGRDLVPTLRAQGHEVVAATRAQVDITDPTAVRSSVREARPAVVVNCAAYTSVDRAEAEPALAFAINREGASLVARACAVDSIPLCHLSTDFVFTQSPRIPPVPWRTTDRPEPSGVYATSKRQGELACEAAGGPLFLVRTAWLYGNRGPNFPLAILGAARAGRSLRVVADQVGSPTWTGALAEALAWLIPTAHYGTYHLCGEGSVSWFGFAKAVLEEFRVTAAVTPVTAAEWGAAAPRPAFSVLDNSDFIKVGGSSLPAWRRSLAQYREEQDREARGTGD